MIWIVVSLICYGPDDCQRYETSFRNPSWETIEECREQWWREFGGRSYRGRHYRFVTCYPLNY